MDSRLLRRLRYGIASNYNQRLKKSVYQPQPFRRGIHLDLHSLMHNNSRPADRFIATPWVLRLALLAGLFISVATNDHRLAYLGSSSQTEWVQYPSEETEAVLPAVSYAEEQGAYIRSVNVAIAPRHLMLRLAGTQNQIAWNARRDLFRTYHPYLLAFRPVLRRRFSAHGYA